MSSVKRLQFDNGLLNKHITSIDVTDTNTVVFTKYNAGNTENVDVTKGLPQLTFNETTERVVSEKPVETTINSFFLRDQHRVSSGAENVFFSNQGSNINFFPCWQGLKDQSQVENQDLTGVLRPTGRTYTPVLIPSENFGQPISGKAIPYERTSTYSLSISSHGLEFIIAEDINTNTYIEYGVFAASDNRVVYKQQFRNRTYTAGERVTLWMEHPLEAHVGQSMYFCLKKINANTFEEEGFLNVEQSDKLTAEGNPQPYAKVYIRLFEDKELCFKDELSSRYLGVWDASGNIPDLTTLFANNYDFLYVREPGVYNDVEYNLNDKVIFNSTSGEWERLEYPLATIEAIENSAIDEYDLVVDSEYTGDISTGSSFFQIFLILNEFRSFCSDLLFNSTYFI